MKLSTRILSIIMAFAMIVSSMVVVASAEETAPTAPAIVVNPTLVDDGKQVKVDIAIENNPGIVGLRLTLDYDSTQFAIASVENGKILAGDQFYEEKKDPETEEISKELRVTGDPCVLYWLDTANITNLDGANITANGTLATVYFDVNGTLYAGDYEFVVECVEAPQHNLNDVVAEFGEEPFTGTLEVDAVTTVDIIRDGVSVAGQIIDATLANNEEGNLIDLNPKLVTNRADKAEIEKTKKWVSSNTDVATVTEGVVAVTGEKAGEAVISVEYTVDGETISASCTVKVTLEATGIQTELELGIGNKVNLAAKLTTPEGGTLGPVVWTSSDNNIATVSAEGEVEAKATGSATITATVNTTAGDVTSTFYVTVTKDGNVGGGEAGTPAVESVTLNKTELTLEVGASETLTATVAPEGAADVVFTSDNEDVAIVTGAGKVIAVAKGNANITAKAGDKTATCAVTVNEAAFTPVATYNGKDYKTVADALAAAGADAAKSTNDNDVFTVNMIDDATEGYVMITPKVHLNVATYTLTADYIVGFNGSCIYGTPGAASDSAQGVLKVAKENLSLSSKGYCSDTTTDKNKYTLPVWDFANNRYIFSLFIVNTAGAKYGLVVDTDAKTIYFEFFHQATGWVNKNLLNGKASDAGVRVLVNLSWTTEFGEAQQDFVYNDGFVNNVAVNNQTYKISISNYEALGINENNVTSLTVSGMIVTDSLATAFGTPYHGSAQ